MQDAAARAKRPFGAVLLTREANYFILKLMGFPDVKVLVM